VNQGHADSLLRYQRRYGRQDRIFRLGDRVLRTLLRPRPRAAMPQPPPRRILLVNAGYIGDVILTTGLIPVLRDAFPDVEIGFLTGTYSRVVVESHPLIDRTHFLDHWYTSREAAPRWRKMLTYVAVIPGLINELRAAKYDVAIDVRCWFPNLIGLLWMTRIPMRIGYDRVGGAPLLTHPVVYVHEALHEFSYQVRLLANLSIPEKSLAAAWPVLAPPSSAAEAEARSVVPGTSGYCVLHPVASTPAKDWKPENWGGLAQELIARGTRPVVTGTGARAKALAAAISEAAPSSIDAVDALSWPGLVALIARAEAVYSVDTSIGHVASALRRPVISVFGGMMDPVRWAPLGAAVVTKELSCHPCLIKSGCAARECVLGVSAQDVLAAGQALVSPPWGDTKRPLQTP
jgi:ADP-heptose:LPS heptosyltransferase